MESGNHKTSDIHNAVVEASNNFKSAIGKSFQINGKLNCCKYFKDIIAVKMWVKLVK